MYAGGSYAWLPKERVPSTRRRWPVDIVPFPNIPIRDEGRSFATPEGFAAKLYGGAPVLQYQNLKALRPYSIVQTLRAVLSLSARMRTDPRPVVNQNVLSLLLLEGSMASYAES